VNLASVGTTTHTVKLAFNGSNIIVYFDDLATPKISTTDTTTPAYSTGTISLDMWTGRDIYTTTFNHALITQ
jgi:hypothetical protein